MRISDWSSDVCSSDLIGVHVQMKQPTIRATPIIGCCIPLRFRSEVTDQTNVQRFQLSMMIDIETGWAFRTKDEDTAHLTAASRSEERRVGKEGSVRVDSGGGRIMKTKKEESKLHIEPVTTQHTIIQ